MKLISENNKIELTINEQGEINSIKYNNDEILHDGSKWWEKTFPMIWPNLGHSTGFEINGKEYELPKHGFWKDLDWQWFYEDEKLMLVATHFKNEKFPFSIDISFEIYIVENKIHLRTSFTNVSSDKNPAYFHFGLHPAFKIDENSKIIFDGKNPTQIDFDGKHIESHESIEVIKDAKFGTKYDTLVFKNHAWDSIRIQNDKYSILWTTDANNTQIWKPKDAMFICVEPWYGVNDKEYDSPKSPKHKKEIIELFSAETWVAENVIEIIENKK